jgi:hypothetical protein
MSPASVGNGVYEQRVQALMRNQLFNGNNLFRTLVVGWDRRIKNKNTEVEEELNQKDYLGIGAQIISDQLVGGLIQSNYVTINTAYHIALSAENKSSLSLGLGGTFSQTFLDQSKLNLGSQLYGQLNGLGTTLNTYTFKKFPYTLTANTGIMYMRHDNEHFFQLSANAFLYSVPDVTESVNSTASNMRISGFMNLENIINEYSTYLIHASYNFRLNNGNNDRQILLGASFGFPLSFDYGTVKRLYVGGYYRYEDAFIPTISFMMDRYNIGMSYDIYSNNKTGATIKQNGFEISLSKSFGKKKGDLLKTLFD